MRRNAIAPAVLLFAAGAALAGCSSDAPAPAPAAAARQGQAPAVDAVELGLADTDLGRVVTDGTGRTLYAFTQDGPNAPACTEDCLATWPALTSGAPAAPGAGLDGSKVHGAGEGGRHVSYGEWPLYYYAGDDAPGETGGQGVDGLWFAVGADGKLVRTEV